MQKECKKVAKLTVDTDVVILAVASFSKTVPDQFLFAFGVASNCRYIAVHEIVFTMNPTKCLTLPEHHAFIACDTVGPTFIRWQRKENYLGHLVVVFGREWCSIKRFSVGQVRLVKNQWNCWSDLWC